VVTVKRHQHIDAENRRFDKQLAEIIGWLQKNNLRAVIPIRGPARFEKTS
jgi:hypothetical protein